jgi:hypothetical protein
MSAEEQDITTGETEAPEPGADEAVADAPQAHEAVDAGDSVADDAPVEEPVAEEPAAAEPLVEEPVAEEPAAAEPAAEEPAVEEAVVEEATAEEPVAEGAAEEAVAEEPATSAEAFGPVRVARVYVCERGHRTTTLWGEPDTCQARPLRSGPECGFKLYHITELPEQVQKALNPLKASKKASKKK